MECIEQNTDVFDADVAFAEADVSELGVKTACRLLFENLQEMLASFLVLDLKPEQIAGHVLSRQLSFEFEQFL